MTKLEDLIANLCPNGVEYKRFDEACTLNARIGWQRLTRAEFQKSGEYMLITGTDFTSAYTVNYDTCVYVSEERYLQDKKIQIKNGDVLVTKDGTLGKVAFVNDLSKPATLNGGVFVVRSKDGSLLGRYVMYYLLSSHFSSVVEAQKTGSTISHLTQALFSRLLIPVPPLPVQEEIVRILDKFTALSQELSQELALRKKQYEYYKNFLLSFDENVPRMRLGEIGSVCMCKRVLKSQTNSSTGVPFYKIGTFGKVADSFISIETFTEYTAKYKFPKKGDVLISAAGTIGRTVVYDGKPAYFQDSNIVWLDNDETKVLNPYLYYCYSTKPWKISEGGTIPRLYNENILNAVIPVPSLREQAKIVDVLDRFDKLTTDISIGLPAEIAARRKQYEYYRDHLLTFPAKAN